MDLTRTAINNFATHCSKLKPEIEGSALKSVSYTHLVEWLEQKTDFNILGIIRYSKKVAENTFMRKPVSYTHLDVYKRQV